MGHEFMGIVEEIGAGVGNLRIGDRVVVPFPVACGGCFFCKVGLTTHCEHSNPAHYGPDGGLTKGKGGGLFGYTDPVAAIREITAGRGADGMPYNKFPLHQVFDKGIQLMAGQAWVHRYIDKLISLVEHDEVVLEDIITHNVPLEQAEKMYEIFNNKEDNCVKVVLKP